VLAAGSVVIAAGAWSGGIGGLPTSLPVRPVRGQMFSLAADAASDRVARIVETADCYLVPREERLLVGATVEEVGWRQGPTPAGLAMLAAAAARVVPATAEAAIVESWAGFRPGTPDDLPILGRDPDMPDVLYATGHFRNGILLAPITAAAIADLLTGRAAVADLAPFGVARFRSTDA
jgi:glycine oxidase